MIKYKEFFEEVEPGMALEIKYDAGTKDEIYLMFENIFIRLVVSFENNQHAKYWKEDFYGLSTDVVTKLGTTFSGGALHPWKELHNMV